MTVDRDLVTRKLLLVVADLEALRPIADRGPDEYVKSWIDQAVVERYLERINAHLKSSEGAERRSSPNKTPDRGGT